MESLAAFTLACGVIQVVDFSTKVAKKCHELYKDGVTSENRDIEEMAKHLTDLCNNLGLKDQGGVDDILDLGLKCSSTAQTLIEELEKLKVNGPHRKWQAVRTALETRSKRKVIDNIQKQLENYQKLLDSTILVDLRFVHY